MSGMESTRLLYTYGRTANYEKYFDENAQPIKLGRCIWKGEPYDGGIVFLTRDAAKAALPPEFSVYGILVPGGIANVSDDPDGGHSLLVDAPLVRLP